MEKSLFVSVNLTSKRKGDTMSANNFVVIMKDPITGEEKNLTMPGPQKPAMNSCRRFKRIGMENIYVGVNKKKPAKKKKSKVDTAAFAPMPESEEEWANSLVKAMEIDKNEAK